MHFLLKVLLYLLIVFWKIRIGTLYEENICEYISLHALTLVSIRKTFIFQTHSLCVYSPTNNNFFLRCSNMPSFSTTDWHLALRGHPESTYAIKTLNFDSPLPPVGICTLSNAPPSPYISNFNTEYYALFSESP